MTAPEHAAVRTRLVLLMGGRMECEMTSAGTVPVSVAVTEPVAAVAVATRA